MFMIPGVQNTAVFLLKGPDPFGVLSLLYFVLGILSKSKYCGAFLLPSRSHKKPCLGRSTSQKEYIFPESNFIPGWYRPAALLKPHIWVPKARMTSGVLLPGACDPPTTGFLCFTLQTKGLTLKSVDFPLLCHKTMGFP